MFPFALPLLIGGGLGALTNKKNPLKGALLGAGMGALGGAVAPAMGGLLGNAGAAATYGTGLGTQQTAMLAAQEAGMGGLGGLKTALGYAEPISQAMSTAQQFMGPDEAPVPPPQLQQQNGGQILAQLAQPQQVQTSEQERMMRRQQRRGVTRMNGLLDFLKTPEGQGLLSATFGGLAGARRGTPFNNIGRAGLAGLAGYSGAQDRIADAEKQKQADEVRNMQLAQMKRQMAAQETADAEKLRIDGLVRNALMPVAGVDANAVSGVTGPRPEAAAVIGAQKPIDFKACLLVGVPLDRIEQLAKVPNIGRKKVARTVKGVGPDGKEYEYQVDEYGERIGDGLAQYRPPLQVDQGDKQTFADPYSFQPLTSFAVNQSPGTRPQEPRSSSAPRTSGQPVSVVAPNGVTYTFPDAKAAQSFKMKAGIK